MILKLRMLGEKEGIAWKLMDNIKQIDYKYIDEPKNIKEIKESGILYINTYPAVSYDGANKRIVEISIQYEDKVFDVIYTDDIVFIMNDNGKTCDNINVY